MLLSKISRPLLSATLMASLMAHAQDTTLSGANGQTAQSDGANILTQAVVKAGVLSCAARVEQVTRFLGFGPNAGASAMVPAQPADQRVFALQMEVPAGAASNSLVDMTFAPQQANGCGASYEAISYWTQNCESLASGPFAQLKRMKAMQKDVLLLDGGPASRVFLIQAGTGCVSVKKEIVL
jgi:hypothetical protein